MFFQRFLLRCKHDLIHIYICRIPDKEAAAAGSQSPRAPPATVQQRHAEGNSLHSTLFSLHIPGRTFPAQRNKVLTGSDPQALLEFLQRVIDHKEHNKMTLNNVAMVMAPNIFMFKGFRSKISGQQEFAMATGMANIVRLLIRYQDLLWTVRASLSADSTDSSFFYLK